VEKDKISKLHEEWKISHFQVKGNLQKMELLYTHPPRSPGPCYMKGPVIYLFIKKTMCPIFLIKMPYRDLASHDRDCQATLCWGWPWPTLGKGLTGPAGRLFGTAFWGQGLPLPHAPYKASPQFGPFAVGPPYLPNFTHCPLSTDKRCNGWEHFFWIDFFPILCVLLKQFPSSPFPHKNVILNSNFETQILYWTSIQHVFGIGLGKIYGIMKTKTFESMYITQEDIAIYLNFIHLIWIAKWLDK
jgi:hypothetical protein